VCSSDLYKLAGARTFDGRARFPRNIGGEFKKFSGVVQIMRAALAGFAIGGSIGRREALRGGLLVMPPYRFPSHGRA
jgi:hypothetical protein